MTGFWKYPPRKGHQQPVSRREEGLIKSFLTGLVTLLLIIAVGIIFLSVLQKAQDKHIHDRINLSAPVGMG